MVDAHTSTNSDRDFSGSLPSFGKRAQQVLIIRLCHSHFRSLIGSGYVVQLGAMPEFFGGSTINGDSVYKTHADLLRDLVEIVREEVQWLVSEGAQYIQFDAPYYSHYIDPRQREQVRKEGLDPDREMETAIAGDNRAFADIPRKNVTVALHVCRGDSRSRWYTEGGYDAIVETLVGLLDVDVFLFEYDTQLAGGFEPLRHVPQGKTATGLGRRSRATSTRRLFDRRRYSRYIPFLRRRPRLSLWILCRSRRDV